MKVFLYYIGKPKDTHANAMADDFLRRASHYAATQMLEIKPEKTNLLAKHPNATRVYLDPDGKSMDSIQFSSLFNKAEMSGKDLVFLIGGANGLPEAWRADAHLLLSLSRMTFSHELARALLAEQIYRAWTILRGHPYPR